MPLAVALFAAALITASAPRDTIPSDTIVARYLAAIGGADKLAADSSLRFSGQYKEGSFHAGTTILMRRPDLRRVSVISTDNFPYIELFDGTAEWEFSEAFQRPIQRDTGAAERAGRRGAEFDESFVGYRGKGHRVQSRGMTSIEGREVAALRVFLADGWEKEYYFDTKTWLIVGLRKAMPIHATGPDVETISYYSDYRRVDGLLRPFRFVERNVRTGKDLNTLQWASITANVPIRGEAFQPPAGP